MLKKTVTYMDYNGVERTEDFYFNLTKAELMEMELSTSGGMKDRLLKIVDSKDVPALISVFKDILQKSYGEKTPDGRRFIKSQEVLEAFTQTEAYSQIYIELATDADAAVKFVNGIIPASLEAEIQKAKNDGTLDKLSVVQ